MRTDKISFEYPNLYALNVYVYACMYVCIYTHMDKKGILM